MDAEEDNSGVEAIKILCGHDMNVGINVVRKKKLPLNI